MNIFSTPHAPDRHHIRTGIRTSAALVLMLCLATFTTGWKKSDTLGVAVGIGQQVAPKILESRQANAQQKATEKKRPEDERRCIDVIMQDPDSTYRHISDYMHKHGESNADNVLDAIKYTALCSESDGVPLYKEEIYSGASYPYMRYIVGSDAKEFKPGSITISDKPFMPAVVINGGSNYPAFLFFFLGDAQKDVASSRSSCALYGLAQTFPAGTEAKDVGMRARQKYNASFKMEASNVEIKKNVRLMPYSYSYSSSTLVLTNDSFFVKLVVNNSNSLNVVKIDKEEFRKLYFSDKDMHMQLTLQIGLGYEEIVAFIENTDNKYKMGYDELNAFYTGLNKGFDASYNEELPGEKIQEMKDESGQVTMLVFDSNLVSSYRNILELAENERREAARAAEMKEAAEKEEQRKKALDF